MIFSKLIPNVWLSFISKPKILFSTYLEYVSFIVFNIKIELKSEKDPNPWHLSKYLYIYMVFSVNCISYFWKKRKIDFNYVKFELVAAAT